MERPIRIMLAAVGTFLFAITVAWLVMNLSIAWLNSMAANDPVRQLWDPRIQRAVPHCIEIFIGLWLLLFGLCWLFTHGLRGSRHI